MPRCESRIMRVIPRMPPPPSDDTADARLVALDHAVVAHLLDRSRQLPAQSIAIELVKRRRVGTDDLEPHHGIGHEFLPKKSRRRVACPALGLLLVGPLRDATAPAPRRVLVDRAALRRA